MSATLRCVLPLRDTRQRIATHCNILQHTITYCNTLHHSERDLKMRLALKRHAATHCNTLQYTATHCSTLQHTATHLVQLSNRVPRIWEVFKDLCTLRTQHHTATHCNTLQHTATHLVQLPNRVPRIREMLKDLCTQNHFKSAQKEQKKIVGVSFANTEHSEETCLQTISFNLKEIFCSTVFCFCKCLSN